MSRLENQEFLFVESQEVEVVANNPNGAFVNADQYLPETPEYCEIFSSYWHDYVKKSGLSQEEIKGYEQRRLQDRETKLSTQISWLKNIGFRTVEWPYQYMQFCVVVAQK